MTPRVRATAILIEDGKLLLVQQRVTISLSRGWSLPGGTLEAGETLGACLRREVSEETGLDVIPERLLYVCDRLADGRHTVHITFAVRRVGGALCLGEEPEDDANPIRDVAWVPLEDLRAYGFSERFYELAQQGFPDAGTYQGEIEAIGL